MMFEVMSERIQMKFFRFSALIAALSLFPLGALADPVRISGLLRIEALFPVLQEEGAAYGEDLRADLLGGGSDDGWRAEVLAIHAPARLLPEFEQRLSDGLADADQVAIETWLETPLAREMIAREIETRRALLDPMTEAEAISRADDAALRGDPRIAAVRRVIAVSDLIETNVVGGLNANLAFYRAMAAGDAFPYEVTERDMLADVAAQEEEIRVDTTSWLEAYLYAAYAPFSIDQIDQIAAFNATAAGRALRRAEFAAYDRVYEQTSADLGAAIARRISAAEL